MLPGISILENSVSGLSFERPQSGVRDLHPDNLDRRAARPHGFGSHRSETITNKARDCFGCESMGEHECLREAARGVAKYSERTAAKPRHYYVSGVAALARSRLHLLREPRLADY
jgi:hypothetical protein